MSQTVSASPIVARQPHSGHTPPTSPIDSIHLALLRQDADDPSSSAAYARKHPLSDPPELSLEPPPSAGLASGWKFSWSGSGKGKGKEKGHTRTISGEETSDDLLRKKKRSLSDRLAEASGEMKRRMSGAGGVRPGNDEKLRKAGGRWEEFKRIAGMRVRYAVKKGNLPFVIIFMVCLVMFLSALAGVGYVPPPDAVNSAAAKFQLGRPVFDPLDDVPGQEVMAARKKMEEAWERKKRPKDGAWMRKARDDGAKRRKAKSVPTGEKKERPPPIDESIRAEAKAEGGES